MRTIKVPATSANLGPGFDCLGLALSPSDTFLIEPSDKDILDNVEERFNNRDNLFLQAYRRGCEALHIQDHIHAVFQCGIPVSRGLGSSAALIVAGLAAASVLHDSALSRDDIFELASEMEGHPDNAAPCMFGGLTACLKKDDGSYLFRKMKTAENLFFTALIPDVEESTEQARSILPKQYSKEDTAACISHGILMVEALNRGDLDLMKEASKDRIHEPYRSTLIPHYTDVRNICTAENNVLLISGSGSTLLCIGLEPLSRDAENEIRKLPENWKIRKLRPAGGAEVQENGLWHPII